MKSIKLNINYCILIIALISCSSEDNIYEILVPEINEAFSGGDATNFDVSKNAFSFPAKILTSN